jgi:hypothetical protein
MATGFTPEKLKQIHDEFETHLPVEPAFEDAESAPVLSRVSFAGTENGILIHLDFGAAGVKNVFLNPLVARTLIEGINEGGTSHRWWPSLANKEVAIGPELTRADLDSAVFVRSLRTGSVPAGVLVVTDRLSWFMDPTFSAAIAWSVDQTAKRAGWWDPASFEIMPANDSQH